MSVALLSTAVGFPAKLYSVAATISERLLFSFGVGMLLTLVVWLLLRVFRNRDSRTSFAVWFATLVITAVLPVASSLLSSAGRAAEHASGAVITVSANWAVYIFLAWFTLASLGLARVAVALWQVRRLRRESAALDVDSLGPDLRILIKQFNQYPILCAKNAQRMGHPRLRRLELLVSRHLEVPTALGFFKPAIVLPEWLLKETPAEELKYILLHELAHLRRRDDWTNLAQQIVKALLFFVPSVWWIERRLALDREMACDDAVLAQSGTPQGYAECLARVAERSFLRRQLALAQAAVSKLRQLTVRVTRILDPNRQQPARMWKPALPAVVIAAGLCAFTASQGPTLVGFSDGSRPLASAEVSAQPVAGGSLVQSSVGAKTAQAATMSQSPGNGQPKFVPAGLKIDEIEQGSKASVQDSSRRMKSGAQQRSRAGKLYTLTNLHVENKIPRGAMVLASAETAQPQYVSVREELMIVVSQRGNDKPEAWQVRVVTVSVTQAQPKKQIPKKI